MRTAAAEQQRIHAAQDSGDSPCCWICLAGEDAGPLVLPCKCPALFSHRGCLARWQLQRVGRHEERSCRFCRSALPPWPQALLRSDAEQHTGNPHAALVCAITTIDVLFEDQMVSIPCFPGERGAELFQRQVRHVFNLNANAKLDVTFELEAPALASSLGDTVWLNGFEYFDVAFQMASAAAAMRGPATRSASHATRASHTSHAPEVPRQHDLHTPTPPAPPQRARSGVPAATSNQEVSGDSQQAQGSETPSTSYAPVTRCPGSGSFPSQLCHSISDVSPASLQAARRALGGVGGDYSAMALSTSGVAPSHTQPAPSRRPHPCSRERAHSVPTALPALAPTAVPSSLATPTHAPAAFSGGSGRPGGESAKARGGAAAVVAAVRGHWTWRLAPERTTSLPLLKKLSKAVHRSWVAVGDWF